VRCEYMSPRRLPDRSAAAMLAVTTFGRTEHTEIVSGCTNSSARKMRDFRRLASKSARKMRAENGGQGACLPWNQSQSGVGGTEHCCRRILSPSHVAHISVVSGRVVVIRLQQSTQTLGTDDAEM
jgi:hypothetical protein